MREIVKLGVILFLITSSVALLLGVANLATEDRIALLNKQAQDEARMTVLSTADSFEQMSIDGLGEGDYKSVSSVFVGKSNGNIVGYSIGVAPNGFGGVIDMIVGIDTKGKITGIHIVNHAETPGLGSKANEPKFKEQFEGKTTENLLEVIKNGTPKDNEIVAISGATISSNAVTEGVNMAVKIYKEKIESQ